MAKASGDVSRTVCANTVQQNERRLREARIRNQGKGRVRQDLNKLFGKINQAVEASSLKSSKRLGLSCYSRSVSNCWYGPIPEFPPGSWWGIRMDCSRDRIHEPFDADIHEGPFGVISICTSHANVNEDVDFGDYLTLTGQVYHPEQSSVDPLICNYKNQIPLRLIRSYNLQDDIAPNTGYRYDGLYTVINSWIGIASDGTKYNKFALMRLADQGSPSWSNKGLEELPSMRHYIPLTKSNHSNTYDLRKCSNNVGITYGKRKLSHGDNLESRSIAKVMPLNDTSKQSAPESSIVTRHVFKKLPSNADNAISTSVPDQKMLLCLGASTTKTHSTNISIRMGLYESSHNSQDAKKNVSTMLHKPSKPIDITIRTALDIESSRLTPKEESKPNKRTDVDKVDPRPSENVSCNGHIVADYASKVASPLDKRKENLLETIQSEHSHSISLLQTSLENDVTLEHKEQLLNAQQSNIQDSSINNELVQKLNPSNKSLRDSVTHKKTCEHHDILETPSESLRAQDIKSLDSLTPDKILNLINKEMHHPLSKLLIGNVIGLTIEECAIWNASKTETAPNSKSKKNVSARTSLRRKRKGTDNIKENVACLDNRRYCKYAKSERLFWKVPKQADGGKFDKVLPSVDQSCNDENQKRNSNVRRSDRNNMSKENNEYLSSFRVQTSLQTIAQHTRNSYDIKTRLRTDKTAILAKPEFPKSSIKKSKYKKRDREIANLSIDANFGPATRGPRNRRLRCKNNAYTRCCGTFNTVIYSPNKRCKSTFERKNKLTKISRQRAGEKQTKDRYRMSNTMHTNSKDINLIAKQKNLKDNSGNNNNNNNNNNNENRNNYNDNSVNNRKKENETATTGDRDVIKASFDKNLRKKLTIPLSQTPRLHCFRKKQIEKPSTMDATTQCRLISENPEVYVIGQLNDQKAILKMEWDKLEKLQSVDVPDGRWSQVYQASQYCAISALAEDNASRKSDEEYVDSPQDKTSAFVPVNAFDNDLRIARLRSIGFKPIITPRSPSLVTRDLEIIQNALVQTTSKVTKRDVAEGYYKYANNEDNNAVVYMDDELQYQDIEEEDDNEKQLAANPTIKSTLRGQSKRDNVLAETLPSRELESPWHGWKKIVKNNESYWIGW